MTPSEAVDLKTLVDYSEGAIVSRALIQSKVGTLTLFAFDKGQGLSEHSAPFDALVQVLDGQAEIVIGGQTIPTVAGQTVLMPADIPHAVNAPGRFKMLLTMIRG
ncbi:MAG: cupin domain-containing protein [bacterium]|nr:MAG: cupin domain-containing protein [bacterium]